MFIRFFYTVFIAAFLLLSFSACKSSIPTTATSDKHVEHHQKEDDNEGSLPEWITSAPDTSVYYSSVRSRKKTGHEDVIEATLEDAKKDLFDQFLLHAHENSFISGNYPEHLELYKAQLRKKLPFIIGEETFRGIYETQDSIWVYCSIKKTRFEEILSHKRASALSLAKSYLINGEQLEKSNPDQALKYYVKGLWNLRYFWLDHLIVTHQKNEVSLPVALDEKLRTHLKKLNVNVKPGKATFNPLDTDAPLSFSAFSEWEYEQHEKGADPLQINAAFSQGEGKVKINGNKTLAYPSPDSVDIYKIRFSVHPLKIIAHEVGDFAQFYWQSLPQQSKTISIKKIKPTVQLITDRDSSHAFVKKLNNFMAKHNLKEGNEATVYIQLTEKEEFELNEDRKVVATMTLYMELVNVSSGKILERRSIGPVEGIGTSESDARSEAYENAFQPTADLLLEMFWPFI